MTVAIDLRLVAMGAALALRLAVMATLLPFLGGRAVPVLWKLILALVLGAALAPAAAVAAPPPPALNWQLVAGEAARSLLVGAMLALVLSLPFEAVKFAGQIIDVQIGYAIVNTIDPQSGVQISVLANLYYLLAALFFFAIDGHRVLVEALVQSCVAAPPFASQDVAPGAWLLVREFSAFFRLGMQVAAPCAITMLLVSAAMGVIVKTVPQIHILVVGFPVKIAAGLAVVGLSLPFFRQVLGQLLSGMEGQLGRLLAVWQ